MGRPAHKLSDSLHLGRFNRCFASISGGFNGGPIVRGGREGEKRECGKVSSAKFQRQGSRKAVPHFSFVVYLRSKVFSTLTNNNIDEE
jgi:hypothetical protein